MEHHSSTSAIHPVILCGGSGTRLWPVSRKSCPKPFLPLIGDTTLFEQAIERVAGDDQFAAPMIVAGAAHLPLITAQMHGAEHRIVVEPMARNTAPAIALAAALLPPDAIMLVCPSDHYIADCAAFRRAAIAAAQLAAQDYLVAFGIAADRPETGYGYLRRGAAISGGFQIAQFVEKPDLERARGYLASGEYSWNGGIFAFRAGALLDELAAHCPQMAKAVQDAVAKGREAGAHFHPDADSFAAIAGESIDYAVMERADNLSVVPFAAGWSDLGGWDAVWRESAQDDRGVATAGQATAIDCDSTLLRSEDDRVQLVGIGLKDIVAVAMPDAVLVADASRAQDVKLAVSALKDKGAQQATHFPKDHRPWGWFESLVIGDRFQVKRIHVHPGAALSLQSHHHRSEHWIVVEGTAKVTVDDDVKLVSENQSVYIPLGAVHRMENPGKVPMVLIEVQTGTYLGEDDIMRYEDIYSRS